MTLEYDFDIHPLAPEEWDQRHKNDSADVDAGRSIDGEIALFRSRETVEALCAMPKSFRTWFLQAGFGLSRYEEGAAPGHYFAQEEAARLAIIDRLADTTPDFSEADRQAIKVGAFDLDAFIEAFSAATPLSDDASEETAEDADIPAQEAAQQTGQASGRQAPGWPSPDELDFGPLTLPPELALSPEYAMRKGGLDPRLMVIGGLAAISVAFLLLV